MDEETTFYSWATVALYQDEQHRMALERQQEYAALEAARRQVHPDIVTRAVAPARHRWIVPGPFSIPLGMSLLDDLHDKMLLETMLPVRRYDEAWFEAAESALV